MIGSAVINKILNMAAEEHPTIQHSNCINNEKGHCCNVCIGICEQGVYSDDDVHYEKCVNCNRCSANCPSQAILPPPLIQNTLETIFSSSKNEIYIQCNESNKYSDIDIECISSLPWEIYVALSTKGKVFISLSNCEGCLHKDSSRKLITEIHERVFESYFVDSFVVSTKNIDESLLSRREMLSVMKRKSANTINFFLSKKDQLSSEKLIYRTFLSQALSKMKDDTGNKTLKMYSPLINDSCWGCGLCSSYCPMGAILLTSSNHNPKISFKPWLCIQCNSCIRKCPEHAICGFEKINCAAQIEYEIKLDINYHYCEKCGNSQKPMGNQWFCYYCGNTESMKA